MANILKEILRIVYPEHGSDASAQFLIDIMNHSFQSNSPNKETRSQASQAWRAWRSWQAQEFSKEPNRWPKDEKQAKCNAEKKQDSSAYADVRETETHIYIFMDLPGVEKDKINLTITDNILLLSVDRKMYLGSEDTFYIQERYNGSIHRQIVLPGNINKRTKIASYTDGVLYVRFDKMVENSEKIEIN